MSLTKKDIHNVAHLARLSIDEQEIDGYVEQLSNALKLISRLSPIKTDDVEPMAHPLHCTQRLRADTVTESDQRTKFMRIAPEIEAGLYLVPKVIE